VDACFLCNRTTMLREMIKHTWDVSLPGQISTLVNGKAKARNTVYLSWVLKCDLAVTNHKDLASDSYQPQKRGDVFIIIEQNNIIDKHHTIRLGHMIFRNDFQLLKLSICIICKWYKIFLSYTLELHVTLHCVIIHHKHEKLYTVTQSP
jgi:hypothetical protein